MSKYSICLIDDQLPARNYPDLIDDTKILSHNNFKHLLNDEEIWDEIELLSLVKNLFSNTNYELSGFLHHNFFLNYIEELEYSPDIIIFDWNVDGIPNDQSKNNLLAILKSKYCLIIIFTSKDNKGEISNIIDSEEFKKYKERLFIRNKGEEDSVTKLSELIKIKNDYFSFKLNQILKRNTIDAIDNILINIDNLSFNQFLSIFGSKEIDNPNKRVLAHIDFIDIFSEKVKYELMNKNNFLDSIEFEANQTQVSNDDLLNQLWHYRIYHKSDVDSVRKGDILKKDQDVNTLFIVVTSDCHLNKFWKKTLGYITMLPIHLISEENADFVEKLNYTNLNYKETSLVNPRGIDFLPVLPAIKIDGQLDYNCYAINPREIISMYFSPEKKEGKIDDRNLKISDMQSFNKVISISEPYLSNIIQFSKQHISGLGLPDFSTEYQDYIKNKVNGLKK